MDNRQKRIAARNWLTRAEEDLRQNELFEGQTREAFKLARDRLTEAGRQGVDHSGALEALRSLSEQCAEVGCDPGAYLIGVSADGLEQYVDQVHELLTTEERPVRIHRPGDEEPPRVIDLDELSWLEDLSAEERLDLARRSREIQQPNRDRPYTRPAWDQEMAEAFGWPSEDESEEDT